MFIKKYKIIPYLVIVLALSVVVFGIRWFIGAPIDNQKVYIYLNIIGAIVLLGFTLVYFMAVLKFPIHKIYLGAGISLGLVFMLIITPNSAADESNHYYKCYDFSNLFWGHGITEDSKEHLMRECDANLGLSKDISVENYSYLAEHFFEGSGNSDMVTMTVDDVTYENKDVLFYFPAILGIIIGRVLGIGGVGTYMLARVLLFAAYMAITYFALKKIPVLKREFAVILLMPSVLSRASAVTYDGLLMAYIFLFVAIVAYYIKNKTTIKVADAIFLVLTGIGITVAKGGVYLPFLLLLFLIPKNCFGTKVKYPVVVASAIVLSLVAYCLCNFSLFADLAGSASETANDLLWTEEEGYTLKYILTHPKDSLVMIAKTAMTFGYKWFGEAIGDGYGWLQVYVSPFLILAYTVILLVSVANMGEDEIVPSKKQKLMMIGIALISSILVVLSMWIFWTPLSYEVIVGVQGRYFIPMFMLLIPILKNKYLEIKKDITNGIILASVLIVIISAMDIVASL